MQLLLLQGQEVVKKVSKGKPCILNVICACPLPVEITWCCLCSGHEVVEVDGFVFKRRRKTMLQAVDNLPPASAQRSAGSPVDGLILAGSASAKTPARTPGQGTPSRILAAAQGAQDFAQQPQPQQTNDAAKAAVQEILSKAFRSNSLELSCLTMSAAQMELQHLPTSMQEQLQTVLQDVADRFSALLRPSLRPTALEVQQASNTPPKQLTSKFYKLLLRQDLQKLHEQKAEWAELLAKYSEVPAPVPAPAEEQEGQQQEVAKPLDVTQIGQHVHTKIAVQVGCPCAAGCSILACQSASACCSLVSSTCVCT
jgi:hypothetical protein